jgi:uncharacterized protein YceK
MKGVRGPLLAGAVAVLLSGCGTVCNLASGNPDNYGGVQRDLQFASDATDRGGLCRPRPGDTGWGAACVLALYGADLSLSFVADTLTLPLATYLRQRHENPAGD